jgi:HAD superfamily hydrolase (TIGR01509 family)
MNRNIEAIFIDSGNTMRVIEKDDAFQHQILQKLMELVGAQEPLAAFYERLEQRYADYKQLAKGTLLQASETELWTRWMLPDHPADKIAPLVGQLTILWHDRKGHHVPRPDSKKTILELHQRGYRLGIIANSISTLEIPNWLEADGLKQYFKTVVLSSNFGRRKPDLHIFLEAAYLIGAKPVNCAYIGDNPSQDIKGARQAGFGLTVILDANTPEKAPIGSQPIPDEVIHKFSDLLKIFPPR